MGNTTNDTIVHGSMLSLLLCSTQFYDKISVIKIANILVFQKRTTEHIEIHANFVHQHFHDSQIHYCSSRHVV